MTKKAIKKQALIDFAHVVLEIMANTPDWDADMNERIATEAQERGLAETDLIDGMFKDLSTRKDE